MRYLLAQLESGFGGQVIDFDSSSATIEHVLPANAAEGWVSFPSDERSRDVGRLGNLTPLEYELNQPLGNSSFEKKRAIYQTSQYRLTQGITQVHWSPAAIRERQRAMAEKAVFLWRIEDQ